MTIPEKLIEVVLKTRGFQLSGFLLAAAVVTLTKWQTSRSTLGLSALEPHVGWFTVIGLACISLLVGVSVMGALGRRLQARRLRVGWTRLLRNLTDDEKAVLRKYIDQNVRTQHLSFSEGVANGLEAKKILYRASSLGSHTAHFAYNIQDGAFEILKRHPEFLASVTA
jgi:hypothetical protein